MSKREIIALVLFVIGILWFFVENFYFGWHFKAESALEGAADFMVWVFWGLAYFIRPTRIEKKIYNIEKGTFNFLADSTLNVKKEDSDA